MKTISERVIIPLGDPVTHLSTALMDMNLQLIKFVPWQRAMTMYVRGSVNVLQPYLREIEPGLAEVLQIKTARESFPLPFIVSLKQFVYDPYAGYLKSNSEFATRRAILTRDGFTCAYCNKRGDTIDHIVPQSKGGRNTWENLVTACRSCNNKKADRTPEQAGMVLLHTPESYDGGREALETEIHELLMRESGSLAV